MQKGAFLTDFQNTALKINKISNLSILNPVICIQSLLLSVVDIQWSMVWKKGSIQINQDQSRVGWFATTSACKNMGEKTEKKESSKWSSFFGVSESHPEWKRSVAWHMHHIIKNFNLGLHYAFTTYSPLNLKPIVL